ncbi:MAG: two-component system activity regulator YycH [Symbiobacteriia bacterium]
MKSESVSSVLLAVLVAGSLVLTGALWFQPGGNITAAPPGLKVPVKDYPSQDQVVMPRQMVAHLGNDRHALLLPGRPGFSDTWAAARRVLAHLDSTEGIVLTPGDLAAFGKGPSLELTFPAALPLSDWLWVWRGTPGRQLWPATRHVLIDLSPTVEVLLQVDGEDRWVRAPLTSGSTRLTDVLRDLNRFDVPVAQPLPARVQGLDISPDIWVPADGLPVAAAHVIADPLKPDVLVHSFFPDPSVVRRIQERDGAVIYTDGVQLVRAYPNGQFEYSRPGPTEAPNSRSLADSLEQTLEFVALHGGWLVDTILVQQRQDPGASHFGFGLQFAGLPLVYRQPPLQVSVAGDGVTVYNRAAEPPQGPADPAQPAISASRALEVVARAADRRGNIRVEDMYLGYVRVAGGILRPAWVVVLNVGETDAVDAFTSRILPLP